MSTSTARKDPSTPKTNLKFNVLDIFAFYVT